jgi:hypothetical protein
LGKNNCIYNNINISVDNKVVRFPTEVKCEEPFEWLFFYPLELYVRDIGIKWRKTRKVKKWSRYKSTNSYDKK